MRGRATCKILLSYTIKYHQYNYSRKSDAFPFFPLFVVGLLGFFNQHGLTCKSSGLNEVSADIVLPGNELKMLALLH